MIKTLSTLELVIRVICGFYIQTRFYFYYARATKPYARNDSRMLTHCQSEIIKANERQTVAWYPDSFVLSFFPFFFLLNGLVYLILHSLFSASLGSPRAPSGAMGGETHYSARWLIKRAVKLKKLKVWNARIWNECRSDIAHCARLICLSARLAKYENTCLKRGIFIWTSPAKFHQYNAFEKCKDSLLSSICKRYLYLRN